MIELGREALRAEALAAAQFEQARVMAGAELSPLHHRADEQHLVAREAELVADLLIGEAHVLLLALDLGPVEHANRIARAFLEIVAHAEDEIAERGDHLL